MPEETGPYEIRFADETKKEFRKLGHAARVDILVAIRKKLGKRPDEYGEPSPAGWPDTASGPTGTTRISTSR